MHDPPSRRPHLRDLPSSPCAWVLAGLVVAGVLFFTTIVPGLRQGLNLSPPTPLTPKELPWITTGRMGTFAAFCVVATACTLWWDRRNEGKYEPLGIVAMCLCVLGHGQAVRAGEYLRMNEAVWPINLVQVIVGMLLVATLVGGLSWLRILLSKTRFRGRMLATCALVCSPCTAFIIHTFMAERFVWPLEQDGVELPTAYHSRNAKGVELEEWERLVILADGTLVSTPLEEMARTMPEEYGRPDDPILLNVDRRAPWSAVSRALAALDEFRIWKTVLATRWQEPPGRTVIWTYRWTQVDAPITGVTSVLRFTAEGFELDGRTVSSERDLMNAMDEIQGDPQELVLHIDAAPDTPWQQVVWGVSAALRSFELVYIGRFGFSIQS